MTKSVFAYRNGVLCGEALPLSEIAEKTDAPFYCTSAKQIHRNVKAYCAPFSSLKVNLNYVARTNGTLAVLRTMVDAGAGIEVASAGELARALEANINPCCLSLSGRGKSHDDIMAALLANVACIKVESLSELSLIQSVAEVLHKKAPIMLRLDPFREASGFSPSSMKKIACGVVANSSMHFMGVALPREEKTLPLDRYGCQLGALASCTQELACEGIAVKHLGLGMGPRFLLDEKQAKMTSLYVRLVYEMLGDFNGVMGFEAGDSLVHDARVLVTRVLHVKKTENRTILILDASHNEMVLPLHQKEKNEILPIYEGAEKTVSPTIVCDTFGKPLLGADENYSLPEMMVGDLLVIMGAGLFSDMMRATLDNRALIPEIMISGAQYAVVRRRVSVVEQMGWELSPDWVEGRHACAS